MPRTTSRPKALLLLVAVVAGLGWFGLNAWRPGAGSLAASSGADSGSGSGTGTTPRTYRVARSALPVTVAVRGDLESSQNLEVASSVEGQATIIVLAAEGTRVKKGEVVCELDGAALRDALTNQEITTRQAETTFRNAVKTREIAEISVREYVEGTYPQTDLSAENVIRSSETELKIARDKIEWSDRMLGIGFVTPIQNRSDRLNLQRAELNLVNARTRLQVLREYTRPKQLTSLSAAIDQARANELALEVAWVREREKEQKLRDQVAKCRLVAPGDGIVVYANQDMMRGGGSQQPIQEGTAIRERQRILNIPDLSKMRINAKVHESEVERIVPGRHARIRIDALPGESLKGIVDSVRPLPDPPPGGMGGIGTDLKVYTVYIRIVDPPAQLRPGMSGDVEVLVQQPADVLVVPVQAVLQFGGKDHVYVDTADGPRLREVELGTTNDALVEVRRGLGEGEEVLLTPRDVAPDLQRQIAFALGIPDVRWDAAQE
jgi:multidrug efflux pump subunit AcrA (membrane-fusion protein)